MNEQVTQGKEKGKMQDDNYTLDSVYHKGNRLSIDKLELTLIAQALLIKLSYKGSVIQ